MNPSYDPFKNIDKYLDHFTDKDISNEYGEVIGKIKSVWKSEGKLMISGYIPSITKEEEIAISFRTSTILGISFTYHIHTFGCVIVKESLYKGCKIIKKCRYHFMHLFHPLPKMLDDAK
jgi:hypothetical protein